MSSNETHKNLKYKQFRTVFSKLSSSTQQNNKTCKKNLWKLMKISRISAKNRQKTDVLT